MSGLRAGTRLRAVIRSRMGKSGADERRQDGQIIVLFAITLVVMLAFAALVIDLGVLRNNRQILVNATDASALAGGSLLPVTGLPGGAAVTKELALVDTTMAANYPGIATSSYTVEFRCLIGIDGSGAPFISRDIPGDCDPSFSLGPLVPSDFSGAGSTRSSSCDPVHTKDTCNTVVIVSSTTTQYGFAGVVGINNGSTGAVQSVSCNGACGAPPLVLNDVELVIDKSGSMGGNYSGTPSEPRLYWAKLAANQLVTDLADNGGIGATGNQVGITTFSTASASSDPTAWTSTAAELATKINAITAGGETPTALGMQTATADLIANARNAVGGKVKRVVIFVSDGRPNPDLGPNGLPATDATNNQRPTQADITAYLGSADVAYSILIGTSPYYYAINQGPPLDANINDPDMMKLLATKNDMTATPPQIYYYNVVQASDLPNVFQQIAGQILGSGAHLIQLYPPPLVSSVSNASPPAAGGTIETVGGKYFTGATQVLVGGAISPYTVLSDSSLTVKIPAGAHNSTVDIVVTTGGGSSLETSADQITYN
jgi:von Willebrand factor type A domain/Putative Flp pilus-assembly TadE/G-like/IPT/TIG domain